MARRQKIWARRDIAGPGNVDTGQDLMSAICVDLGTSVLPPGTTVMRLLINLVTYLDGAAGARSMAFGIKTAEQNVIVPAVGSFGPNVAQHTDWMWWHRETKTAPVAVTRPLGSDKGVIDVHTMRKLPETEGTLAFYYQGNGAIAADQWSITVSALLALP